MAPQDSSSSGIVDTSPPPITPAVLWLVVVNAAIFFAQLTILRPSDVQLALGFQTHNLGRQWWTIGTYMFVHAGFWHLALNMYALWLFGPRVEWHWKAREFLRLYALSGLGGWFAHLAFVPGDSLLIGASASIFGVMWAYATLWPDQRLYVFGFIPVTVRWLLVLVGVINLVGGINASSGQGGVAYLAHLGGLAAAWIYIKSTSSVNLGRLRQAVSPVPDEPEDTPPRAIPRAMPRSRSGESLDDMLARSNANARRAIVGRSMPPTNADEVEIDRLLDKISSAGIESLTSEEMRILGEASR